MYQLKLSLTPLRIIPVIVLIALVIFIPPMKLWASGQFPHFAILPLCLIVASFVSALFTVERANKIQRYQIFMSALAMSSALGILGNLFYNFWFLDGAALSFSIEQLLVMLGGAIAAGFIYDTEPYDSYGDTGLDRLQRGTEGASRTTSENDSPSELMEGAKTEDDTIPKAKLGLGKKRSTATMSGISAQEPETRESSLSEPELTESAPESWNKEKTGQQSDISLAAAAESSIVARGTSEIAAEMDHEDLAPRATSTFHKLKALSKSSQAPADPGVKPGKLRSLLDRLDIDEEEDNEPVASAVVDKPATSVSSDSIVARPSVSQEETHDNLSESTVVQAQDHSNKSTSESGSINLLDKLDQLDKAEKLEESEISQSRQPLPEPPEIHIDFCFTTGKRIFRSDDFSVKEQKIVGVEETRSPAQEDTIAPDSNLLRPQSAESAKEENDFVQDKTALDSESRVEVDKPEAERLETDSINADSINLLSEEEVEPVNDKESDQVEEDDDDAVQLDLIHSRSIISPQLNESLSDTLLDEEGEGLVFDSRAEVIEAPVTESSGASSSERLFKEEVDSEIDEIFSTIAPVSAQETLSESTVEVSNETLLDKAPEPGPESRIETDSSHQATDTESGVIADRHKEDVEHTLEEAIVSISNDKVTAEEALPDRKTDTLLSVGDDEIDEIFSSIVEKPEPTLSPESGQSTEAIEVEKAPEISEFSDAMLSSEITENSETSTIFETSNTSEVKIESEAKVEFEEKLQIEEKIDSDSTPLLTVNEEEIDEIFSNLVGGAEEDKTPVSKQESLEPAAQSNLLNVDDEEIDELFAGLTEKPQQEVSSASFADKAGTENEQTEEKLDEVPTPEPVAMEEDKTALPQTEPTASQGLLKVEDDELDEIFAGLTETEQKDVVKFDPTRTGERLPALDPGAIIDIKTATQTGDMPALPPEEAEKLLEKARAVVETESQASGLINLDDSDVDDIFSGLTESVQKDVSQETLQQFKQVQSGDDIALESNVESIDESIDESIHESKSEEISRDADGGLLNLGDQELDDLFSGLVESSSADDKLTPEALEKLKRARSASETSEVPIEEISREIAEIGTVGTVGTAGTAETAESAESAESAEPVEPVETTIKAEAPGQSTESPADEDDEDDEPSIESGETAVTQAQAHPELKEFGRLSNRSAAAPRPEGQSTGTMKTVGKLLLDHEAVEQIIKTGEAKKKAGKDLATARIISANRGAGITELLSKIDKFEGVSGSLIVGHDGLVMASTVEGEWSKDMLGALSTALLSTTNLATKKLEIGKLRQMVLMTELSGDEKTTVLTDVDVGILAVFVETSARDKIDGLLETIHKTVHGGG